MLHSYLSAFDHSLSDNSCLLSFPSPSWVSRLQMWLSLLRHTALNRLLLWFVHFIPWPQDKSGAGSVSRELVRWEVSITEGRLMSPHSWSPVMLWTSHRPVNYATAKRHWLRGGRRTHSIMVGVMTYIFSTLCCGSIRPHSVWVPSTLECCLNSASLNIHSVPKRATLFLVITSANVNRFSKFFYRQVPKKIIWVAVIAIFTSP